MAALFRLLFVFLVLLVLALVLVPTAIVSRRRAARSLSMTLLVLVLKKEILQVRLFARTAHISVLMPPFLVLLPVPLGVLLFWRLAQQFGQLSVGTTLALLLIHCLLADASVRLDARFFLLSLSTLFF